MVFSSEHLHTGPKTFPPKTLYIAIVGDKSVLHKNNIKLSPDFLNRGQVSGPCMGSEVIFLQAALPLPTKIKGTPDAFLLLLTLHLLGTISEALYLVLLRHQKRATHSLVLGPGLLCLLLMSGHLIHSGNFVSGWKVCKKDVFFHHHRRGEKDKPKS